MGKASRDKGKRGEREARDQVRDLWQCPDCVRSMQVSGTFSSDLMYGPEGLHLEVKRYRNIAAFKFLTQAKEDAGPGITPVVLMRQDGDGWAVMIPMEDTIDFARRLLSHLEQQEASLSNVREQQIPGD